TVTAPARTEAPAFAAAVIVTTPGPFPLGGATESQVALACADHAQPAGALIVTCACCAGAVSASEGGLAVNVHGRPACETLIVWPAIVTDPLRAIEDGLFCGVSVSVPLPVPRPLEAPMKLALFCTVHEQDA